MQFKWIVFVLMVWILVAFLVGVVEGVMVGGPIDPETGVASATTIIHDLMNGSFFARANAFVGMMAFDFPTIFHGGYAFLKWVFFLPFVVAFAVMMLGYILAHIPVIGRGS